MPKKFHIAREGRGGWCKWIIPKPQRGKNYLLKCCDCGLVHEMQFKTIITLPKKYRGVYTIEGLNTMFRARRQKKK